MYENFCGYSDQVRDFYHVYSDGKLSSSIFIQPEDFIKAINLIPQYAIKNNLKVLAYTVTGTHLHMMLRGPYSVVQTFMSEYKSMILRYFFFYWKEDKDRYVSYVGERDGNFCTGKENHLLYP